MQLEVKVPLLGFEHVQTMSYSKIDDIFATLTADTEDKLPSFTLVNPFALRSYDFDIPQASQVLLDLHESSNVLIYNTVIIHNPIEESMVNFLAPIIINQDNNTMLQLILDSTRYRDYGIGEPIRTFMQGSEV